MKKYLLVFVIFYAFLHLAKIEVFPLYHFGMYSEYQDFKEEPYVSYDVYIDEVKQSFENKDYRKYTYLINTIEKYDAILSNDSIDPESDIILKYLSVLGIEKTSQVKSAYTYTDLHAKMSDWIKRFLKCPQHKEVVIEKSEYHFDNNQQMVLKAKSILLQQ